MKTNSLVRCGVVLCFLTALCAVCHAADPKAKAAGKPTTVRTTGTLDSIAADKLEVTTKEYGKVTVVATAKSEVRVKANFGLDMIKPGMYLSFSGPLTGTTVEGEVEKATMFSLVDGFKPGVVKVGDGNPSILGKVESISDQTLTINAGRKITATFSKNVQVNLDSGDMTLATPGCKVEIRGSLTGKEVKASFVTFWLAQEPAKAAPKPAATK